MNLTKDEVTEFSIAPATRLVDEFCIHFKATIDTRLIGDVPKRKPRMSDSEVITIMILFHTDEFRDIKHFYLFCEAAFTK